MSAPAGLAAALPQYQVGSVIGSGGMGVVFSGVHRSLGRQVAIKQLPATVAGDPDVNARFDREARVLASLDHPHIVPVYDYVQTGADNLLVMEKLDGGTVYDAFRGRGLTGEQSCAIGLAMLAGLHAAHSAGVLHLDVKPKNLLFTSAGVMKVADFGISQVVSEGATLMTHAGEVLGTPAYIAPEQAMGNSLTPAADLYAAGTVLYELLCGDLPFDRTRGAVSMMRQRMFTDPQPLPRVPAPLSTVVMRSLAREPRNRYRDAEAFAVDLGAAATAVFGHGWLERAGVPVHLGPRVLGSIANQSGPDNPTVVTQPVRGTGAPEHTRVFQPAELRPASEVLGDNTRPPLPDRSSLPGRSSPPDRSSPPHQSPLPGRSPLLPALAAALALVLMLALPFLAPKTLDHPATANPPAIDGKPAVTPVALDLSQPFTVTGSSGSPDPFTLRFALSAAEVGLGAVEVPMTPNPDGTFSAVVEPAPLTRWLVGGAATGSLTIGGGEPQLFAVLPPQAPIASVMGGGSLLLGLFALAYLESVMRTLRRGHRRPAAPFAALPLGAVLGLGVWLLVSTLGAREPSLGHAIGAVAAGALGAAALVLATAWSARRRTG